MILFILLNLVLAVYCFFISTELGISIYSWIFRIANPPVAERLIKRGQSYIELVNILPVIYALGMLVLFKQARTVYGIPLLLPLSFGILLLIIRTLVTVWLARTGSKKIFFYWILGLSAIGALYSLSTFFSFSLYNTVTINGSRAIYSLHSILLTATSWYTSIFVLLSCLIFAALHLAYTHEEMVVKRIFSLLAGAFSLGTIVLMAVASHFLAQKEFMYQLVHTPLILPLLYLFYILTALVGFSRFFVSFRTLHWLLFVLSFSAFYYAQLPYVVRPLIQMSDRIGGASYLHTTLLFGGIIILLIPCFWLLTRWMRTFRGVEL